MMLPIIGITCGRLQGLSWAPNLLTSLANAVHEEYANAVFESGGVPILIPVDQNAETVSALMERIDGLLLTGGADIHPCRYNEEPHKNIGSIDNKRDEMEFLALKSAWERNIPVFGVCRGHQFINVFFKGSLYQDIPAQMEGAFCHSQVSEKNINTHTVSIENGSLLHRILKKDRLLVNSKHHQSVKTVGVGIKVIAKTDDGIVESIERPSRPFFMSVQWHPECTFKTDPDSRKIFSAFIQAANGNYPD